MKDSQIEWTHNTFNPWWGCMKVSEGCKNCYAAALDNRYNNADPHWGPNSPRKPMSEAYWKQLSKWDADAKKAGIQEFVFCASMADWAESQETLKHYESYLMVQDARLRLFQNIATTPSLIYQLLTKRIDNVMPLIDSIHGPLFMHDVLEDGNKEYLAKYKEAYHLLTDWLNGKPPQNVWIGTSVENQETANERIPELLKVPAKVRFLSCEPLLGPVDLSLITQTVAPGFFGDCLSWHHRGKSHVDDKIDYPTIHWVIAGGESGHGARPMHPDWAASLRDQCISAGVAFFFKQWGEYLPNCQSEGINTDGFKEVEFPSPNSPGKMNQYYKMGKHFSGAVLDGKEYKEFPVC